MAEMVAWRTWERRGFHAEAQREFTIPFQEEMRAADRFSLLSGRAQSVAAMNIRVNALGSGTFVPLTANIVVSGP